MAYQIDDLQINVASDVSKAIKSLQSLKTSLESFKNLNHLTIPENFVKNIKTLSSIKFSSSDAQALGQLGKSLQSFKNIGKIGLSKSTSDNIRSLAEATTKIGDVSKLNQLSQSMRGFDGIKLSSTLSTHLQGMTKALDGLQRVDFTKFNDLSKFLHSLSEIPKGNLQILITQLKKIPALAKEMNNIQGFDKFVRRLKELALAMQPLSVGMQKLGVAFSRLPANIKKADGAMKMFNSTAATGAKKTGLLSNVLAHFGGKAGLFFLGASAIRSGFFSALDRANAYVENLNLLEVAMGNNTTAAVEFAEAVQEAVGIDTSEWIRIQGVFQLLATGFGVASDRAAIMSKNLTQLSYDLSSLENLPIERTSLALQSAISGELEPARRLGFDLSQAKLQATAYELGINKLITSMTQAEKAQLRYYALLNQVTVAHGDMAKTLASPANQFRVLKSQVAAAARAIGNLFIPVVGAVLPYINALVKAVANLANMIAKFFGIEPISFDQSSVDTSGIAGLNEDLEETQAGAGKAGKALKKMRDYTLGFDELNIFKKEDPSAAGGGGGGGVGGGGGGAFDFALPEYDFLQGADNTFDHIVKKIENMARVMASVWEPVAARTVEFFHTLREQASHVDLGRAFGGLVLAANNAFAQVAMLSATILMPVLEGLNIPETTYFGIEMLSSALNAFASVLENIVIPIVKPFAETVIKPLAEWIGEKLREGLISARENFNDLSDWAEEHKPQFEELGEKFADVAEQLGELIKPMANDIWNTFKDIVGFIVDKFKEWADNIDWEWWSGKLDDIAGYLKEFNKEWEKAWNGESTNLAVNAIKTIAQHLDKLIVLIFTLKGIGAIGRFIGGATGMTGRFMGAYEEMTGEAAPFGRDKDLERYNKKKDKKNKRRNRRGGKRGRRGLMGSARRSGAILRTGAYMLGGKSRGFKETMVGRPGILGPDAPGQKLDRGKRGLFRTPLNVETRRARLGRGFRSVGGGARRGFGAIGRGAKFMGRGAVKGAGLLGRSIGAIGRGFGGIGRGGLGIASMAMPMMGGSIGLPGYGLGGFGGFGGMGMPGMGLGGLKLPKGGMGKKAGLFSKLGTKKVGGKFLGTFAKKLPKFGMKLAGKQAMGTALPGVGNAVMALWSAADFAGMIGSTLYETSPQFQAFVDENLARLKEFGAGAKASLKNAFTDENGNVSVIAGLKNLKTAIAPALKTAGDAISKGLEGIFGKDKIDAAKQFGSKWADKLKDGLSSVKDKIKGVFDNVMGAIENSRFGKVLDWVREKKDGITSMFGKIPDFFGGIFGSAADKTESAFEGVDDEFAKISNNMTNSMSSFRVDGAVSELDRLRLAVTDPVYMDEYGLTGVLDTTRESLGLLNNDIDVSINKLDALKRQIMYAAIDEAQTATAQITRKAINKKYGVSANMFASGGYPEMGELFIAREAGPELVGTIGNRTAVANNEQIVAGIANGVATANGAQINMLNQIYTIMTQLLKKDTSVYLDSMQINRAINNNLRYGGY